MLEVKPALICTLGAFAKGLLHLWLEKGALLTCTGSTENLGIAQREPGGMGSGG